MATAPRITTLAPRPTARPAVTPKTLAAGPIQAPKVALVCTATLIRGRTYVYKSIFFKAHIPEVVTREIADALREEFHAVTDSDGEAIEKPYFDVEYDVPAPVEEKEEKVVNRLSSKRVIR